MKREDLKAKGYTDEQIDHILDEFHKEQEGLKGQIQTLLLFFSNYKKFLR